MTAPELIQLFLFLAGFRPALRDQLRDQIPPFGAYVEFSTQPFEHGKPALQYEPIVLHASIQGYALAKAKLLSELRWNHNASLSTYSNLWHQVVNVPEVHLNGNKV